MTGPVGAVLCGGASSRMGADKAALQVAGVATSWADGLEIAGAAIDDGRASDVLDRWIAVSQHAAGGAS